MSDNKKKPRSPAIDYLAAAIPAAAYNVVFGTLETVNNVATRQAKELRLDKKTVLTDLLNSGQMLRASLPSSYRYVISQGMDFTLKETINSRLNLSDQIWPLMLATHFLTGAVAGLTSFTILYPEDIITNQQVINKKTGKVTQIPPRDVIKSVWEIKGLRGFYYKYGWNAPAVAVNKGIYFGVYDTLKRHAMDEEYRTWFSMNFLAGCASTFLATIVPHPLFLASGSTTPKITYREAVKEELRSFATWKIPSLGIRSVRGGLLLATFDKITSLVYYGKSKKKKVEEKEKYVL